MKRPWRRQSSQERTSYRLVPVRTNFLGYEPKKALGVNAPAASKGEPEPARRHVDVKVLFVNIQHSTGPKQPQCISACNRK